jgi:hypothetical protein
MTYCGMHGELNGSVEATKNKAECQFSGVFDLGSAAIVPVSAEAGPKPQGAAPDAAKPESAGTEAVRQPAPAPDETKKELKDEPRQEKSSRAERSRCEVKQQGTVLCRRLRRRARPSPSRGV